MDESVHKKPTLRYAVITLIVLVAFIVVCMRIFSFNISTAMFLSWFVLFPFAMYLGYKPKEIENSIYDMVKVAVSLFVLFLSVGCMVAVWLSAGTIPTLIYWGLKLISPKWFLAICFLLCCIVSIPTGTSWGTMSTIGVAMMAVGMGLGLPAGMVAGAVISGACFGNTISPASDCPMLTISVSNVEYGDFLKRILRVHIPAFVLCFVAYLVLGFTCAEKSLDESTIFGMLEALDSNMHIGIVTLLPLVVVLVLLLLHQPAVSSIMIGCIVGVLVACFYQGYPISKVGSFLSGGFSITTGNSLLDPLLNRGGMSSMLGLITNIIASLGIGGILKGCGFLDTFIDALVKVVKTRNSLTTVSFISAVACNMLVSAFYFGIVVNSTLLVPMYEKLGYKRENGARVFSVLADTTSMLIPWTANAIFVCSTFGVTYEQYAPWLFFSFAGILLTLIYGYTGYSMTKIDNLTDKK